MRFASAITWAVLRSRASEDSLRKRHDCGFQASVVVERDNGERFVFSDLHNRVYRWQAYERGIGWAKRWIDINYQRGAHESAKKCEQDHVAAN
jgi:hypothetical protein